MMNRIQKTAANMLLNYIADDPLEKLPKIIELAEKLDKDNMHATQIKAVREILSDENNVWYTFVKNLVQEVDKKLFKKFVECFIINANFEGYARGREIERKYDCNVPWAILMDPTSACNLSCTGCWAAQYGSRHNLSYETLDSICRQGKELGIYFYIFSGGEPLVRKKDIIRLCEAHQDCYFFAFTNGTLVDDELCEDMLRVGNFALAFSIEGDEEATDMRRGKGTYRKVIEAMERMKAHRLLFGYSTCYHRYNTESVGSDAFVDDMIARGCRFAWNFTYMPVGKDARLDLIATPEQRAYMYRRINEIRATKPIFAMDFWNDGEYADGCIAGGKRYLHINAAGDVEPCAFIHYSNVNIHDVSLLDALRSPLFMAYRRRQPFNGNMLRPCPLLDNPEMLREMVKESGAKSTDMEAPEDVDVLCAKTAPAARAWAETADRLWAENPKSRKTACEAVQ
ncbi:radical SAM protein [Thermoclostridium caenicola]|uniref:Radical SAM superfamily enzyme, MoaA/NifB/PqqE/SkfB family n=1 Tax=Thermoclostridium caenicola TaxID=659425 RepID=A0A1M6I0G7_9FIRM|nr:Radical SAM superfamily enzyme, MoaA/NifB/PqqE/SkfB family [Thermoclostridium caenicola]